MKFPLYFLLIFIILISTSYSYSSNTHWDYYHNTSQINETITHLLLECGNILNEEIISKDPTIQVYTFDNPRSKINSINKKKAFLLFGEHAREIISSETGFHFLQQLCSPNKEYQAFVSNIFENYIIKMIVIANPDGRKFVEAGDYCWRGNGNRVDINRNWNAHWKAKKSFDDLYQTDPGKHAFSEKETIAIEKVIRNFNPDIFLSIHSGLYSLMMPYAYSQKKAVENHDPMMGLLENIKKKYCTFCGVGEIFKVVKYASYGSVVDYVYDVLKTPLAFVFEIYESKTDAPRFKEILKMNNRKYSLRSKEALMNHGELRVVQEPEKCLELFNPLGKNEYNKSIKLWLDSIIELLQAGYQELQKLEVKETKIIENSI